MIFILHVSAYVHPLYAPIHAFVHHEHLANSERRGAHLFPINLSRTRPFLLLRGWINFEYEWKINDNRTMTNNTPTWEMTYISGLAVNVFGQSQIL